MKRFTGSFWALPLLVLSAMSCWAQNAPLPLVKQLPIAKPEQVLFIGNSLMYYSGGLQTHTHRIAAAANPPLDVRAGYKSVHITSASLEEFPVDYLLTPGNLKAKQPYQVVVLSPSSRDAMSDAGRAAYRKKVKIGRAHV